MISKKTIKSALSSPISWLLIATFFKQIIWTGIVPLWHFPDEQSHFAQVQNNALFGIRYIATSSDEIAVSEKLLGTFREPDGKTLFFFHPEYKIPYTNTLTGIYEEQIKQFPREYTTANELREVPDYPFLYYWLASGFYKITGSSDLITRVFTVRFLAIILFTATIYIGYLIGNLIFKNRNWALGLATLMAFHPMFSFIGASVNSDVLFNLLFTTFIYGGLLIISHQYIKGWIITSVSLILGLITKQQMAIALILTIVPLFLSLYFFKQLFNKNKKLSTGGMLAFMLMFGLVLNRGRVSLIYDSVQSINNQLPWSNLSLIEHTRWTLVHTYREILPWYWGVFKWLGVALPRWTNRIQMGTLLFTGIGLTLWSVSGIKNCLTKKMKPSNQQLAVIFLIIAAAGYYIALLLWDWQFRRSHVFSFGIQGRYYFPAIAAQMALILIGLRTLVETFKKKALVTGLLVIIVLWWIVLQMVGIWTILQSYYDTSLVSTLIIQLSQYKPLWFKGNWWYGWSIAAIIPLIIFCFLYIRQILLPEKQLVSEINENK